MTSNLCPSSGRTSFPGADSDAFHRRLALLFFGGEGGAIALHYVLSGKEREKLRGHTVKIASLAWNLDSSRWISASMDGTAVVWDTQFLDDERRP